jgi:hypothetical protein
VVIVQIDDKSAPGQDAGGNNNHYDQLEQDQQRRENCCIHNYSQICYCTPALLIVTSLNGFFKKVAVIYRHCQEIDTAFFISSK